MSRQRDYQPTIDRARNQAEISERRIAKLREKADENHREMLRQKAAARLADEEADALRDRNAALEQSIRDLKRDNANLRTEREGIYAVVQVMREDLEAAQHPWRTFWRKARERAAGMFRKWEEA